MRISADLVVPMLRSSCFSFFDIIFYYVLCCMFLGMSSCCTIEVINLSVCQVSVFVHVNYALDFAFKLFKIQRDCFIIGILQNLLILKLSCFFNLF